MDGDIHHGHDSDVKLKKIPSYSRSDLRIEVTAVSAAIVVPSGFGQLNWLEPSFTARSLARDMKTTYT